MFAIGCKIQLKKLQSKKKVKIISKVKGEGLGGEN